VGAVKSEWRHESLGWFAATRARRAGLVLYRQLPRLKRYLAYLPEGPVIDWSTDRLGAGWRRWPRTSRQQGAFGIRMGPPVVTRRWSAAQVKDGHRRRRRTPLGDLPPTERDPVGPAWSPSSRARLAPQGAEAGSPLGQPQYVFQVPLRRPHRGRRARGHEPALAPQHQEGRQGGRRGHPHRRGDERPQAFHDLYVHTAERDHFTPAAAALLPDDVDALGAEDPDRIRLYLAGTRATWSPTRLDPGGRHTWYSYGASSTEKRDGRGSNAVQWQMIRDARRGGATVYDLRGITDTLDADDRTSG
jgi:vancomycin resistance protein VanK